MNTELEKKIKRIKSDGIQKDSLMDLTYCYYDVVVNHLFEKEYEGDYDKEVYSPIELRSSGIKEAMNTLIENGADVNGDDGLYSPMMLATAWGDSDMVSFLLDKGADPNKWPDMDEEPEEYRKNWYLEDIDVHYMTECWEKECDNDYLNGLVKTAMVLINKGGLRNFCGYSLYVDENGHGSIRPAELKY